MKCSVGYSAGVDEIGKQNGKTTYRVGGLEFLGLELSYHKKLSLLGFFQTRYSRRHMPIRSRPAMIGLPLE